MNPLVHVDILDELPDVLVDIMGVTILGQVNFLLFDGAHQSLGIAILGRLADLSHADLGNGYCQLIRKDKGSCWVITKKDAGVQ